MASLFSIAILSINNKNQILYLPNYRAQTYYTETDWPYGHLGNARCAAQINKILMNNGPI